MPLGDVRATVRREGRFRRHGGAPPTDPNVTVGVPQRSIEDFWREAGVAQQRAAALQERYDALWALMPERLSDMWIAYARSGNYRTVYGQMEAAEAYIRAAYSNVPANVHPDDWDLFIEDVTHSIWLENDIPQMQRWLESRGQFPRGIPRP